MKRMLVRAAVFAALTTGVGIAGAGNALACSPQPASRSDNLASTLPQVRYGQHGQHVLALQLALRNSGYTYLQGTGNYAANTLKAVRDFQRKHGIKDSGIVGSKTWHALVGAMPAWSTSRNGVDKKPETFTIYLTPGQRNRDAVDELSNLLERIHPYGDQLLSRSYGDDTYDAGLQKAVKDFQRRSGIKASGIVGPKTTKALVEAVSAGGQWGC